MVQVICRGLRFDLGGVLVDSTPAVARVWSDWAIEHGFEPEEIVRRAHGRPSMTTIRELLPNADHEAENRKVEQGEIADTGGVVPMPGARELLDYLPGVRWVILTLFNRTWVEVRIEECILSI